MKLGVKIATAAVASSMSLPGTAWADVYCTGIPSEINTKSDGTVLFYATWREGWITICNIDRVRNGVSPTLCMNWTAQLISAASDGKTMGFYYASANDCTSIATFDNSPAPAYIRFIG